MRRWAFGCWFSSAVGALVLGAPAAAEHVVSLAGVVVDAANKPVAHARLRLTSLDHGRTLVGYADENGKYSVGGGPTGPYLIEIRSADGACLKKERSYLGDIDVVPAPISFQVGVGDSGCATAPPPAATIEALRRAAQTALDAKDWQGALAPLKTWIDLDPDDWRPFAELGDAQWALGHVEDAYGAAGSGQDRLSDSFDARTASEAAWAQKQGEVAHLMTIQGEALLRMQMVDQGIQMLAWAAGDYPNPTAAYAAFCAVRYASSRPDDGAAACDTAIAADPKAADAYFFKGAFMTAAATRDALSMVAATPDAASVLRRYLELAPSGVYADEARALIQSAGSK